MNKTCKNCEMMHDCQDNAASWLFLFVGLIATVAIRIVNIVMDFSPFWAKIAWYVGVAGFLIYFLYKYRQHKNMRRLLLNSDITRKLSRGEAFSKEESAFLSSLLCALRSRKDMINFFVIFLTSVLALLLGIYKDFINK